MVPEIYYDKAWHMFDADLIEYFPKADGSIASIQEIVDGVTKWKAAHPEYATINKDEPLCLHEPARLERRPRGPAAQPLLRRQRLAALRGVRLGRHHAAIRRDQQQLAIVLLDGLPRECATPPGRETHAQLVNKGLHVNMDRGERPGSLTAKVGEGSLRHSPRWGDLAPGRVGNGTLVYDVPLASGAFRGGALTAVNLAAKSEDKAGPAVHVKDAEGPGRARYPHAFQLRVPRRPDGVHAGARRGRRDQGTRLRQQRPGLEAGRHGR